MNSAQEIVDDLVNRVKKENRIKVLLNTKLIGRDGTYGNYDMEVEDVNTGERTVHRVGTMVLTLGMDTYDPKEGEYGWQTVPQVITTMDLERKLRNGELKKTPKNPVFIHCVGSRQNPGEGNSSHLYTERTDGDIPRCKSLLSIQRTHSTICK
jgi:heterodisulfide reductase subunit A-like polyferredoxin